jgi:hypothetical protein
VGELVVWAGIHRPGSVRSPSAAGDRIDQNEIVRYSSLFNTNP